MKLMKNAGKMLIWTMALTGVSAMATERPQDGAKASTNSQVQSLTRPDNTVINERDKYGATKTPQDQSNRVEDREMLAAVRRSVVGDESLSTMAKNVKIVVDNGTVTLRGPVKNSDEKAKVELHARSVKGITTTDNQLDVKTSTAAQ